MREGKIAVVGDRDLILAFKAIGMEVFAATDVEQCENLIKKLAKTHAVIFVTEDYAKACEHVISRYKSTAYPAIVPIPSGAGSTGYGMENIKKDVEKAVGTDILFNKED